MSNLTGQSLGRYHILEPLGEGGMAVVYKAYDTRLERDVAVKVIRRGAFPPDHLEQILKRFERESRALAKLFHPNIVKVLDFGNHEGSPFMVLEYSPGGTLKRRLGKPIPWREAIELLLPIARALEYAHGQGIVHRDVKPSNILLTKTNQPLLTDFGIAKILESGDTTTLTGTGAGIGTPEYMAPEQWTGKAEARSDIYSLGVILYEMVTGRKPYVADTPAAILLKQATEPLPRPTLFAPDLPEGVERILIKALARNPEDRFTDMAAFTSAMENRLQGRDVVSLTGFGSGATQTASGTFATLQQDDSRLTHLQENTYDTRSLPRPTGADRDRTQSDAPAGRKSAFPVWAVGLIAGGLLLTALCVGIVLASGVLDLGERPAQPALPSPITNSRPVDVPTEIPPAPTEPQQNVQPLESPPTAVPPPPTETPTLEIPPTDIPPTSAPVSISNSEPTGKIVYTCQVSGKANFNEICLINADGSGFRQLTNNGADNGWPSLSPNGNNVFYSGNQTGSYQIYRYSLGNGSETQMTSGPGQAMAPDVSPSGQIVYTLSTTMESIWVMNKDGSGQHQVYKLGWDPGWSPDGSQILFATGTVQNVYHAIINADGSGFRQLTDLADLRGRSDWSPLNLIALYAGPSWKRNVYTVNADGSNLTQITFGGNSQGPSFSPDGNWIAFTAYFDNMGDSNGCEIYIMRVDGSDRRRLTSNSYCDWQPRWGP
ncbi:MAG: Serine/threonine-protein kinase PknD [Gammaproteobacteria bacterium]|nr:Serine/threonine-protein kinase PknD [Gammaproteobacteria bacterium]